MEPTKEQTQDLTISNNTNQQQQQSFLRRFGTRAVIYTGGTGLVGYLGIPAVFSWIGFSSAGVVTGSLAASWQSTQVCTGIFSLIQGATTTGAVSGAIMKVGLGAATMKAYIDAKKNQNKTKDDSAPKIRSKL